MHYVNPEIINWIYCKLKSVNYFTNYNNTIYHFTK